MTSAPLLASVAQPHGATVFGLGVVNWLVRLLLDPHQAA
jgi:hypothetical protein